MWEAGNWITFEDWQDVIRTGQIKESGRDCLIVTHRLDYIRADGSTGRMIVHDAIGLEQVRDNWKVA